MPKKIEAHIRAEERAKGHSGKELNRIVYGALNNRGLMHGSKETAKGAKAERKYERGHR